MSLWVNGRRGGTLDPADRGLQYGDGLFETMRVRRGAVRLLDLHLERLYAGCGRLAIRPPPRMRLRRELERAAAGAGEAVLKLIVTRGAGSRGYRPNGTERATRILSLHPLPAASAAGAVRPAVIRLCLTPMGINPRLAGLKTLNRLESVLARAEWRDARIWEGLMADTDGHLVCGTMSNLFVRRGSYLLTPALDRCGVAGVMRRWVLGQAPAAGLCAVEGRLRIEDVERADEVFMTNAVAGVVAVAALLRGRRRLRLPADGGTAARALGARLEAL